MNITFIGHCTRDINVVFGERHIMLGGGVLHNALTASHLGAAVTVLTRCSQKDMPLVKGVFESASVKAVIFPGSTTTCIENVYKDNDPDNRVSKVLTRCESFNADTVSCVGDPVVHVNPLFVSEFPEALFEILRNKVKTLSCDAQGFVRWALEDGTLVLGKWAQCERFLPMLDIFKADNKEAQAMTGESDSREAVKHLHRLGAKEVILTYRYGVLVGDGKCIYEAEFGPYRLDRRTGRGDTCSAAYIFARCSGMAPSEAVKFAADVTTRKLQHPEEFKVPMGPAE